MKKFGLLVVGVIAGMVLLSNIGPMAILGVMLAITYYSFKRFLKAESIFAKILWATIGLAVLTGVVSNAPAVLGIVAAYLLYVVYKKWNEDKVIMEEEVNDPFVNFEKQWAELKKQY
ncbi:flagellar basal body rod protein [Bacillus solimangrovi]|uniref:Flagellar basal body rod protein n=1 Tax=Bacillus solimangrovi TaxID=1305675 RepID=A0A1E5LH10_9BACI|nr:flagellar basal body rod protein [Bacillus solimangrovi]OEH93371.1 flagellar basal body rod protein [Bacillus solimangrovi]